MKNRLFTFLALLSLVLLLVACAPQTTQTQDQSAQTPENTIKIKTDSIPVKTNTTAEQTASGPKTVDVTIENFAFNPRELSIKVGDTVVWTNLDSVAHSVQSDSGSELSSVQLAKGESYTHTFAKEGTYAYHCSPHTNMKAIITVE